jgi:hypothetical protein
MKFFSTQSRMGTITLFPVTTKLDAAGGTHRVPGLRLKLQPAWNPGFFTDAQGDVVQEIANPGPELIDTENIGAENEAALLAYWGDGWEKKLVAWLKEKPNVKRYGFNEGDPRPDRKIKVTMTQAQYDEIQAGKKQLPEAPEFTPGGAAQTVVKGPRSTSRKV